MGRPHHARVWRSDAHPHLGGDPRLTGLLRINWILLKGGRRTARKRKPSQAEVRRETGGQPGRGPLRWRERKGRAGAGGYLERKKEVGNAARRSTPFLARL